ncbi:hypothetical protein C8R45DRAFT_559514 [Mycena sanguinolenta]|nr:hypothetical protein C8R45DRAFT_559514 [Mycena sanguinolenta]
MLWTGETLLATALGGESSSCSVHRLFSSRLCRLLLSVCEPMPCVSLFFFDAVPVLVARDGKQGLFSLVVFQSSIRCASLWNFRAGGTAVCIPRILPSAVLVFLSYDMTGGEHSIRIVVPELPVRRVIGIGVPSVISRGICVVMPAGRVTRQATSEYYAMAGGENSIRIVVPELPVRRVIGVGVPSVISRSICVVMPAGRRTRQAT